MHRRRLARGVGELGWGLCVCRIFDIALTGAFSASGFNGLLRALLAASPSSEANGKNLVSNREKGDNRAGKRNDGGFGYPPFPPVRLLCTPRRRHSLPFFELS